ncbi:MAG: hypothetical protein WD926_01705 [Patescibacteria group bacterium]
MARKGTARTKRSAAPSRQATTSARRPVAPVKTGTARRGFASMSQVRVREVAAKGGKKTAQGHDMAMIGQSGGKVTARRGSAYFARIGRLGGKAGKRGKARRA